MAKRKQDHELISVLEDLEHVRLRPGMYIGSQDENGVKQLLKEVVDNVIDEFLAGNAKKLEVTIDTATNTFSVKDDGRGIPVEVNAQTGKSTLETVVTSLQAGGKFNKGDDQLYSVSAGLHGVGLKAVNALSVKLEARVWRNSGKCYFQRFVRGVPEKDVARDKDNDTQGITGTQITFTPDPQIFGEHKVRIEDIEKLLRETSHLCPGLKVVYTLDSAITTYVSGGLQQLLTEQAEVNNVAFSHQPINYSKDNLHFSLSWALDENDSISGKWWSFVNVSSTKEHGAHVLGLNNAIVDSLKGRSKVTLEARDLTDGLYVAVHALVAEPQFKSQTKDALLNTEVIESVYSVAYPYLKAFFDDNKELAGQIIDRAAKLKEARDSYRKTRKAINQIVVKKNSRGILPAKLAEAPFCKAEERELYVCEGVSASGSAKMARNARTQEVLPLRGKIPNAARKDLAKVLNNEELVAMATAIGVKIGVPDKKKNAEGVETSENDLSRLRVGKIMLLADGDQDGAHIASLILTFFVTWIPELFVRGLVYIVDSPLFVGSYKGQHFYGHTLVEVEKKAGIKADKMLVSRLKGHGEASQEDIKHYAMDPSTRKLYKIILGDNDGEVIAQLMGSETDSRKLLLGI